MSAGRRYRRALRRGRVLFVLPAIHEDASPAVKNGVALRNEATRTGRCPGCGAVAKLPRAPERGAVVEARMAHEDGCPALLEGDR